MLYAEHSLSSESESRRDLPRTETDSCGPVALVGSGGRMGRMLMERLREAGCEVEGIEATDSPERVAAAIAHCRIVLLCLPVGSLRGCLNTLAPLLTEQHLLMDITSVKCLPMTWMEAAFSGAVVGSHPMFGPAAHKEDRRVALVRGERASDQHCAEAARLFQCFGCNIFWTTAEEHDRGVAFSQSLTFAVSAAYFATMARHENIVPYLTPSFSRHMQAARMHLTQDMPMFLEFSAMNPAFPQALETFQQTFAEAADNLAELATEARVWYQQSK